MQCAISEHDTAGVANMRVWVNEVLRLDGREEYSCFDDRQIDR